MKQSKFYKGNTSLEYFGELVGSIGIWVWEMDLNGIHTYSNHAIKEILGYSPEEILGKHITEFWLDDDKTPKNIDWLKKTLASGKGWRNFPSKFRHKDGSEVIVESSAVPLIDEKNKLVGYRCVDRNITTQWKMALDVQQERDKLQKYLDVARVMFVVLDADGNIIMINRKGSEILGYEESELIGKNWFGMCVPKRIRNDVKEIFNKLMAGEIKPVEYYENAIITRKDEEKLIAWHNTVLKNDKGEIIGTIGSGEDITERREALEALRQSEQKYATLVENSNDGIVIIQDKVFKFVNKRAADFFGLSKEEVVGKIFTSVVPPEYREMLMDRYYKRVTDKKAPKQYEVEIERKGEKIPVGITGIKIVYNDRPASMAIISDLRDKKRVEELLRRDKSKLEEKLKIHLAELKQTNEQLAQEVKIREQKENELLKYQKELTRKTKQLEEKNIALKEVLAQIAEEKLRIKQTMANDIEQEIIPIVSRLRQIVPEGGKMLVDLLEDSLNKFTGVPGVLIPLYSRLSRREVEICGLIKSGLTTKEIAQRLNLAITTVQKHRQQIRKKLRITNQGVNLETYLSKIR